MDFKKPWYTVKIETSGVPYDVRINDCPVMSGQSGLPENTEVPVNQWLRNGENTINILLHRLENNYGDCQVTIQLTDYADPNSQPSTVKVLSAKAAPLPTPSKVTDGQNTASTTEPKEIFVSETIILSLPFPEWQWMTTTRVDVTDKDKSDIITIAKELWQAFKDRDTARAHQLFSQRLKEMRIAFYQKEAEYAAEMERIYLAYLDDPDWDVDTFDETDLELVGYGDNRLFLLKDSVTDRSPLAFVNKEKTVGYYFDLYFSKDANGVWQIIR